MEEAPGFALLGVVAVVEVGQQVFDSVRCAQLGIPCMQHGGAAIGLLVDQVNDAMTDWHGNLDVSGAERAALQKSSSLPQSEGDAVAVCWQKCRLFVFCSNLCDLG
ncbi:hypothetical protein D3C79_939450 [compost metagenome]